MGLLWHLLYYPMAVVWLALCAVHTALAWPLLVAQAVAQAQPVLPDR